MSANTILSFATIAIAMIAGLVTLDVLLGGAVYTNRQRRRRRRRIAAATGTAPNPPPTPDFFHTMEYYEAKEKYTLPTEEGDQEEEHPGLPGLAIVDQTDDGLNVGDQVLYRGVHPDYRNKVCRVDGIAWMTVWEQFIFHIHVEEKGLEEDSIVCTSVDLLKLGDNS